MRHFSAVLLSNLIFGCQDTSGIFCDTGGDGIISDTDTPQDGGEHDCDAVSVDQAGECQPDPEPCNTGDPVIDDSNVQQAMEKLWDENFGTDTDPLPHDERNEGMFMVTATQSGYETTQIPPGPETSSCHFDADNVSVPSNIVALIHTHPYSDGDTINDPRCSSGRTYNGETVSSEDASIVQSTINSTTLPPVPMYVIDKDKIRVIDPSNPSKYDDTINRCGY